MAEARQNTTELENFYTPPSNEFQTPPMSNSSNNLVIAMERDNSRLLLIQFQKARDFIVELVINFKKYIKKNKSLVNKLEKMMLNNPDSEAFNLKHIFSVNNLKLSRELLNFLDSPRFEEILHKVVIENKDYLDRVLRLESIINTRILKKTKLKTKKRNPEGKLVNVNKIREVVKVNAKKSKSFYDLVLFILNQKMVESYFRNDEFVINEEFEESIFYFFKNDVDVRHILSGNVVRFQEELIAKFYRNLEIIIVSKTQMNILRAAALGKRSKKFSKKKKSYKKNINE